MPAFVYWILAGIGQFLAGWLARVVFSFGVAIVVSKVALPPLRGFIQGQFSGLGADVVNLFAYLGVDKGLTYILSAMVVLIRAALQFVVNQGVTMSARFSEPLVLFTGLPGSGKTLSAITYSVEARAEGQRVFQVGIKDCNPSVAELWCPKGCDAELMRGPVTDPVVQAMRLEAVSRWRELPPGAVLILDEAQDFFPVRGPGRPPEWIADLAKVRHYGVQIWFCIRMPVISIRSSAVLSAIMCLLRGRRGVRPRLHLRGRR